VDLFIESAGLGRPGWSSTSGHFSGDDQTLQSGFNRRDLFVDLTGWHAEVVVLSSSASFFADVSGDLQARDGSDAGRTLEQLAPSLLTSVSPRGNRHDASRLE
jgi:hypothetical protein